MEVLIPGIVIGSLIALVLLILAFIGSNKYKKEFYKWTKCTECGVWECSIHKFPSL